MASPPQNSDLTFPAADIAGELNPGRNTHFHVDPTSSEVDASKVMMVPTCIFSFSYSCERIITSFPNTRNYQAVLYASYLWSRSISL